MAFVALFSSLTRLQTTSLNIHLYIYFWSERSACASAYEVAIKLGIISLSLLSPPPVI